MARPNTLNPFQKYKRFCYECGEIYETESKARGKLAVCDKCKTNDRKRRGLI
jgi:DNA-directed RNA polymerase subunit M/transcription elongation factor TFIIS